MLLFFGIESFILKTGNTNHVFKNYLILKNIMLYLGDEYLKPLLQFVQYSGIELLRHVAPFRQVHMFE